MATDDWSLKKYASENTPEEWVVRKNLSPAVKPGDPKYRFIAYLTFAYEPRDASGLPTDEDNDLLSDIEESELGELEENGLSVLVAVVLKAGVKDFIFYTRDAHAFEQKAERFREAYPQFEVNYDVSADRGWKQYKEIP